MSLTVDLDLDIRPPGSGIGDLASSLRSVSNLQSTSLGPGMEGSMEAYLDDDDDDMGYLAGQNPLLIGNKHPTIGDNPINGQSEPITLRAKSISSKLSIKTESIGPNSTSIRSISFKHVNEPSHSNPLACISSIQPTCCWIDPSSAHIRPTNPTRWTTISIISPNPSSIS